MKNIPQLPMAVFQLLLNHPSDSSAAFPPFSPESTCFISLTCFPCIVGLRLPPARESASCGIPRILTRRTAPSTRPRVRPGNTAGVQENCFSHAGGDEFLSHVL